ncbi:hypothetical protein [Burkholderia pseudomallei]|uniref:hypothetical protein n=1 Tax=Burkholderia pseudomallei TaxID=28450 RepID=UPI000531911F|nr:hypothetical protein [Burkholderia pseudomallei]KGS31165.1 hypothetical protein X962_6445 [Burkholderia pseudomallei MSHR7343]
MKFELDKVKPWAEFALTCASLIAIPVAGWWAYHNFSVENTHEINPNISVSADVQPYDEDRRLLVVHVRPKNVGKVPIELDGGKSGDIDVEVKVLPRKLPDGHLDPAKLPVKFPARNIVSRFDGGYVLEPGIDYNEIETFVVPKDATYIVRAVMSHFDSDPDDEVDASCVVVVT